MNTLQDILLSGFKQYADSPAISDGNSVISYAKLHHDSDLLARALLARSGGQQLMVGICSENRVKVITALIAILKARCVFVPIDHTLPVARIRHILHTTAAPLLLADQEQVTLLEEWKPVHAAVADIDAWMQETPATAISWPNYDAEDSIYVYFTSGSTGQPKGIVGMNKSLLHFIQWEIGSFRLQRGDRISQFINPGFDAFLRDVFAALCAGATICIPREKETLLHPRKLKAWIHDSGITLIHCVPSFFRLINHDAGETTTFTHLKYILLSGEALRPSELQQWYDQYGDTVHLYNLYGPTETTMIKTAYHIKREDTRRTTIPVGKPMEGAEIWLLDEALQPVESGMPGEIYIRTAYRTKGYLHEPGLNGEKFITYPPGDGEPLYKTGDLGKWLPDGNLELLGRIDRQVKIRGVRVEPGEIESHLLRHPQVSNAVVVARPDEASSYELCAYVVLATAGITMAGIREYLAGLLPDYLVPTHYVMLDKIPLTANGKTDIAALPLPVAVAFPTTATPANTTEQQLAQIWSAILGIPLSQIGRHDDFFKIGGHSLRATILAARIEKTFGIAFPLLDIFYYPVLSEIAARIATAEASRVPAIPPAPVASSYVLSSAQERLYVVQQYNTQSTAYNITTTLAVAGYLDIDRLQLAMQAIIDRHESLRTAFILQEGMPRQVISEQVPFKITRMRAAIGEENTLIHDFIQPFNLQEPPLIRMGVITTAADQHTLVLDIHHAVADGTSLGILVRECLQLYVGEIPAAVPLQYKDYAVWQQQQLPAQALQQQEAYWLQQFAGDVVPLQLPADFPRPARQTLEGASRRFLLDTATYDAVKACAVQYNTTVYTILLTTYLALLQELSGQSDIVIGTIIAGRRQADLMHTIGMFANTLGLRFDIARGATWTELLQYVKIKTTEAQQHQDYPFEELVKRVVKWRDPGRSPLLDVMFNLQNLDLPDIDLPGLSIRRFDVEKHISKFDLTLRGIEEYGRFELTFEYNTNLFTPAAIERFIGGYQRLLNDFIQHPTGRPAEVTLLSKEEEQWLLYQVNAVQEAFPRHRAVHGLFEEQALLHPQRAALEYEGKLLTYQALNENANCIAHALHARGIQPGSVVGLMMDRCPDMITAILAVLKCGAAFFPVDPDYPVARKSYLLADSGVQVLLTNTHTQFDQRPFLEDCGVPHVLCIDNHSWWSSDASNLPIEIAGNTTAYLIYTSGTTGQPKGISIPHSALVNYVSYAIGNYQQGVAMDFPLFTSVAFDLTLTAIFVPLLSGNRMIIYGKRNEDALLLEHILREDKADIIKLTPAHLKIMAALRIRPSRLKVLIVGGEALPYQLALKIHQQFNGDIAIYNEYGPTETTVGCIVHRFNPAEVLESVPIGLPVPNTQVYLLNEYLRPVPIGVTGEIYLGGAQLAHGYTRQEEPGKTKFIPHPFISGERLYRTGDLARWLPQGILLYMGRADEQVKIRGYRVELAEIESTLLLHPGIDATVVAVNENAEGDKYLVAYYTTRHQPEVSTLKQFMAERLPVHMLPAHYVQLDQIPLTTNGKVNRKALPAVAPQRAAEKSSPVMGNPVKDQLRSIWADVLEIPAGDIDDQSDFFRAGGHSLAAITLLAAIQQQWGIQLGLSEVFDTSVFAQQAALLDTAVTMSTAPVTENTAIPVASQQHYYPLSSGQRRLFVLHQLAPQSVAYNIPLFYRVKGSLDIEKTTTIFRQLVQRYDSFRTAFHIREGEPVQYIQAGTDFRITVYDGTDVDMVIRQFIAPFNLECAPLLRAGVMSLATDEYLLMIDTHHIISDEVATRLFMHDFVSLLQGGTLSPVMLQYKDFVMWQREPAQISGINAQKDFWMNHLSGELLPNELPADFPRPAVKGFDGDVVTVQLDVAVTAQLQEIANNEGVTLYMVLLSLYHLLISKLCGQEDILTGTITAGRPHADLQRIHGVFVNTLVLRAKPRHDLPYRDFLQQIKAMTLSCFEHQDYQYEELVEALAVERDTSRNPLFEVMFNMHSIAQETLVLKELTFLPYPYYTTTTKFDLNLQVVQQEAGLTLNFCYATALFKRSTITRWADYYARLVKSIGSHLSQRIGDINLLPENEQEQLIYTFNDTAVPYDKAATLPDIFEDQVARTPSATALATATSHISYDMLNVAANRLAHALIAGGIGPGQFVAVTISRSVEMVVALLGILKSGATYVPLEPYLPDNRIMGIMDTLPVAAVITDTAHATKVASCTGSLSIANPLKICLGKQDHILPPGAWITQQQVDHHPVHNPRLPLLSTSLAYVIFTSGSTGTPKGVAVMHQPVINLIEWLNRRFGIGEQDKLLFTTSLGFDLSVYDIFGILAAGGVVRIASSAEITEPENLVYILLREGITCWDSAPAALQQLVPYLPEARHTGTGSLRLVLLSGDWIPLTLPVDVKRTFTQAQVIALGGATEATVWSNFFPVKDIDPAWRSIPYGKPIQNAAYYILDKQQKCCPIGVKGDLYIGGECLASGYINDAALTAAKFIANPFIPGGTMYYTGDKARWYEDGNIEFLGREDAQVKIRGYRIELGEIEQQLLKYAGLKAVKVVVRTGHSNNRYLCAYYVADQLVEEEALRRFLSGQLPEYMLPAYFIRIAAIPVTVNGKLDLKALPEPADNGKRQYQAPVTETEKVLVNIWGRVLQLDSAIISIDADFFRLGGHSLSATLMLAAVTQELEVKVPLIELFKRPVLKDLAQYVAQACKTLFHHMERAEPADYHPLSPAQQRLFTLQFLMNDSCAYNMPVAFMLTGAIDKARLEQALQSLINRHESLRTIFCLHNGEPVQRVLERVTFQLTWYNGVYASPQEVLDIFIQPFLLEEAPLFRAGIWQQDESHFMLMLDMHHIVSDGISMDILVRDFRSLYQQQATGDIPLSYKDYVHWYLKPATQVMIAEQEAYWLAQFREPAPVLQLPADYERTGLMDFNGEAIRFRVAQETAVALHTLAQQEGVTVFMVLLAALNVLLAKLSGQEDIVIGSPVAARRHVALQQIVGLFVNVLAFRHQPSPGKTFRQFMQEVKQGVLDGFDNGEYPFDALVNKVVSQRDWSRSPLFDVYFYMDNIHIGSLDMPGLQVRIYEMKRKYTQYDIMLGMSQQGTDLAGVFTFATSRFSRATMEQFTACFQQILLLAATHPDQLLHDIRLQSVFVDFK